MERILEMFEHLVTYWIRAKRPSASSSSREHLFESSSPSYCHMERTRCCNGWTRLPINTEMGCPPVKLSINTAILSKNGATADDSITDKEWDHEACLTTRASGLKGARPNCCPATC